MANIIDTLKNLPTKNKIIVLSAFITAVAGVILLFAWSQRPEYRILYSNIADNDAGSILQKLKEMKVPYKVEAGTVMVPEEKVYDLRLQLAAQGLPRGGGVGFELFDKTDFGTTDFVQKLNYRRALQGELVRTILALSEIEQCRVHLATPERSLFMQEEARPSASVLLKMRNGRTLSGNQVQGIVNLVSGSVEGLNPKDVTIIDSQGDMLTRPAGESVGLSSNQLEYQKNYEKELESRVLGILEPVIGKNKVKAKITANIDFTRSEKTEEKYDPDGQVVRSEQKNSEKSTTGGQGGVPGVSSNVPGKAGIQTAISQGGQSQKQNELINYEVSKVTSHVTSATGEIKRLSVAVIVDGNYAVKQGAKDKTYTPRPEEDMKRYEELVMKAVGFTAERGDEVKVVNMQFEGAPSEEMSDAAPPRQYMPVVTAAVKYLAPLLAVVLFILFVMRPVLKSLSLPSASAPQPVTGLSLPQKLTEIEKAMGGQPHDEHAALSHQHVIEWAKTNPDKAANVVRGWLEER